MVFNQFVSIMHFIMYLLLNHQLNKYVWLVNLDDYVIMYGIIIKYNHLMQFSNKNQSLNLLVFITYIHMELMTNFLCAHVNDFGGNNNVFNEIFVLYSI